MVVKWKDYFNFEHGIPHPKVKVISGQISILNRKDLWNDFSDFPRIGIKIQRKHIMFPNNFFWDHLGI